MENQGNLLIKQKILDGEVFCAGKLGRSEFLAIQCISQGIQLPPHLRLLMKLAGFFPDTNEMLETFKTIYINSCKHMDIMSSWVEGDKQFLQSVNPSVDIVALRSLEPYYFDEPWSKELCGKRITVVSPFSRSITRQYDIRKLLWKNPDVLPEFDLQTVKSPYHILQTSTHLHWFEALTALYHATLGTRPDFLLVGAGAYSVPLLTLLKPHGISGVHLGGSTQILFGIKGKRWDDHDVISKFYNSHWVRPSGDEVPDNPSQMEGGCYW